MARTRAQTARGPGMGWRAQLGLCPFGQSDNPGILEEVLTLLGTTITPSAWTGPTPGVAPTAKQWPGVAPTAKQWPGVAPTAKQWPGVAPTTKQWPGVAPTTKQWPGVAPTTKQCPGIAPTTKQWPGFTQKPYWAPTAGGGVSKQYPAGQAGIPYAYYPGVGLVQ